MTEVLSSRVDAPDQSRQIPRIRLTLASGRELIRLIFRSPLTVGLLNSCGKGGCGDRTDAGNRHEDAASLTLARIPDQPNLRPSSAARMRIHLICADRNHRPVSATPAPAPPRDAEGAGRHVAQSNCKFMHVAKQQIRQSVSLASANSTKIPECVLIGIPAHGK